MSAIRVVVVAVAAPEEDGRAALALIVLLLDTIDGEEGRGMSNDFGLAP